MKTSPLMINAKREHSNCNPSMTIILISKIMGIFLFMVCTMIMLTCAPSILMEVSGQAKIPTMEILGFSVSGLNISDTNVTAKWNIVLAIQNTHFVSTMYFDQMEGMVVYKGEVLVANSSLKQPFVLGPREHKVVTLRFRRNEWGIDGVQPMIKDWVVNSIKKDKDGEKIKFDVGMNVWGKIKCGSGWWWTKTVIMKPQLQGFKY